MKKLTVLLLATVAASAHAISDGEDSRPSPTGYFHQAWMAKRCSPDGKIASPELEAYRQHAIEYYRSGAKGAPPNVSEGAELAVQQLESGEIPSAISEKLNKASAKMTPAQRDRMCQMLPQIINTQLQIEKLRVVRDLQGQR